MASSSPSMAQGHSPIRQKSATPHRIARFSPYILSQEKSSGLLNLTGHPLAHPNPPPPPFNLPSTPGTLPSASPAAQEIDTFQRGDNTYLKTWHVELDFSLVENDGRQINPTPQQCAAIKALFPTRVCVEHAPPFLTLHCLTLPPKPWPVSIAGLALFLTTDLYQDPMFMGVRAYGPKLYLDAEIRMWKTPDTKTFIEIFRALRVLGADFESVQWMGFGILLFCAEESCEDWRHKLPSLINDVYVGYVVGPEVREEKALRRKAPQGNDQDDSLYTDYRPGIALAGVPNFPNQYQDNVENNIMSSSGIFVQSPNGKKYITVASHGFPNGVGSQVFHPNSNSHVLGTIERALSISSIFLCELAPGSNYSRQTFRDSNATLTHHHRPFQDFADITGMQVGDLVSMDTPFSGRCEGVVIKIAMRVVSPDDNDALSEKESEYLFSMYVYFGNGSEDVLFDACRGAVIWNSNHNIVGQFGFCVDNVSQLCVCPSFKTLKDKGY